MQCLLLGKVAIWGPTTLPKTRSFTPVGIYLFKVNNRNTRTRCEICSELRHQNDVFIVNFEHISHLVLLFLLLTASKQMPTGTCISKGFYSDFTYLSRFLSIRNVYFPEYFSAASSNRGEIFKIFISTKIIYSRSETRSWENLRRLKFEWKSNSTEMAKDGWYYNIMLLQTCHILHHIAKPEHEV